MRNKTIEHEKRGKQKCLKNSLSFTSVALFSGLDLKEFADQLKAAANDARDYGKIKLEADLDELQKQLRMLHDQV